MASAIVMAVFTARPTSVGTSRRDGKRPRPPASLTDWSTNGTARPAPSGRWRATGFIFPSVHKSYVWKGRNEDHDSALGIFLDSFGRHGLGDPDRMLPEFGRAYDGSIFH